MAMVAGKIFPRPRGKYDSNALYTILDLVAWNNKVWIAKKEVIQNIEPSELNEEYWMLCVDGSTVDTLDLKAYVEKHFSEIDDSIETLNIGKANTSEVLDETISASSWTGDTAPYSNTIQIDSVNEDSIVELVLPSSMTLEKKISYQDAQILNGSQAEGSITIYAWGTKPSIDLPVVIIVRGG